MSPAAPFLLVLNGGYGVGKSATLDHVGDVLAEAGRAFSLFDVDWFHRSWPPATDDPDNVLVEAANLADVWRRYRTVGERQPVLSGVLAGPADRARYEAAFGLAVRSVLLDASADVTTARLRRRYTSDQPGPLAWHLERFARLAADLRAAGGDELVLDTDARTPRALAELVCRRFGLVGREAGR